MRPGKKTVLVAESDDVLRTLLCEILGDRGFDPIEASTSAITLEILRSHRRIDCCFVDLGIDELAAPAYLSALGEATLRAGFPLLLTSFSKDISELAARCRARSWLLKPYDLDELMGMIHELAHSEPVAI